MKRLILVTLVIGAFLFGACTPERASEPAFTTYTDEMGLFSISYPSDWEPVLSVLEEAEQAVKDIIISIDSNLPVERVSFIFMARLPRGTGFSPNVNIVVESLSGILWTLDSVVESSIKQIKNLYQEYHEFSRVKTTIDNRVVTIIVYQATFQGITYRYMQMYILVGKTVWTVTCTALPDEYSKWEDDFNAIVRGLRILRK